jgi:hypothetical protein
MSDLGTLNLNTFLWNFIMASTKNFSQQQLYTLVVQSMRAARSEAHAELIVHQLLLLGPVDLIMPGIISMMKSTGSLIRLFLLKYPTVCIFALITDKVLAVRKAAWRLILATFPSIQPPIAYRTDPPGNYTGVDVISRKELELLLSRLLTFFGAKVIPDIAEYYAQTISPGSLKPEFSILVEVVRLFEWIIIALQDFDQSIFEILECLFYACRPYSQLIDYNVVAISQVLALFPVEIIETVVLPVFLGIFIDCSQLQDSQIAPVALKFWEFARRAPSKWVELIPCSSFIFVYRSLFFCNQEDVLEMATSLTETIVTYFALDDEVRAAIIQAIFSSPYPPSPSCSALLPLLPSLFTLEPNTFPTIFTRFVFSAIATSGISDRTLSSVLSLVLSVADQLSRFPIDSIDIPFRAVALATTRTIVTKDIERFIGIWSSSDSFCGHISFEIARLNTPNAAQILLRLELQRSTPQIEAVISFARRSPAMVVAVLTALADAISDNQAAIEFLMENVGKMLMMETVLTEETKRFYLTALGFLDEYALVELYLQLLDRDDLENENGRPALAKAVLVAAVRPECRETFEELAPLGDPTLLNKEGLWR